ncbi:MAG: hypothetical protein ACFFBQ_19210 [Promethearchaeota archaeon]
MVINSLPDRLDLSDMNCFQARKYNTKFSIGSDAHHISQIAHLKLGIAVARRGWLTKDDIINTLTLKDLKKWLKH